MKELFPLMCSARAWCGMVRAAGAALIGWAGLGWVLFWASSPRGANVTRRYGKERKKTQQFAELFTGRFLILS